MGEVMRNYVKPCNILHKLVFEIKKKTLAVLETFEISTNDYIGFEIFRSGPFVTLICHQSPLLCVIDTQRYQNLQRFHFTFCHFHSIFSFWFSQQ
jgi:hypothetical protein